MAAELDPILRRLERSALLVCAAMALVAFVVSGGHWSPVAGVVGGGLLIAISYRTIGSGVGGIVEMIARSPQPGEAAPKPPRVGRTALIVIGRYALLALLAYVMIARLRLHPLGLMAGASSVVAAAAIEAGRQIMKKS